MAKRDRDFLLSASMTMTSRDDILKERKDLFCLCTHTDTHTRVRGTYVHSGDCIKDIPAYIWVRGTQWSLYINENPCIHMGERYTVEPVYKGHPYIHMGERYTVEPVYKGHPYIHMGERYTVEPVYKGHPYIHMGERYTVKPVYKGQSL